MDLDLIDAERGGPMTILERERLVVLPAATELPWKVLAAAAGSPHAFYAAVWPAEAPLTAWKLDLAHERWLRHNGIPEGNEVRRLVYMMQRYYGGIEYDLRHHLQVSARALWQDRQWRELLGYIDQLPSDSHMHRLLTSDEEHMEHLLRSRKGDDGPGRPSMANWGQLESMIAVLIDAVNRNTAVQQAIANPKGPKPQFTPYPRPYSAAQKIEQKIQKEAHESMVSILLPNRG